MPQTSATEERTLEALANVPIFSRLDDKSRRKLARLCTLKSFEAGDVLYEEGAMGLSVFIVTSGQVEIYKGAGDKKIALETVAAGGVLGHLALLDDQPRGVQRRGARAHRVPAADPRQLRHAGQEGPRDRLVPDAGAGRAGPRAAAAGDGGQAGAGAPTAQAAGAKTAAPGHAAAERSAAANDDAADNPAEPAEAAGDDDETSDVASAMFKMMRMQYGVMAGTAKGMTEMAKAMETFLDSMAEETDLKTSDDWSDLLKRVPEAMVTATRKPMDDGDNAPQEMMDAYRRYSEGKS